MKLRLPFLAALSVAAIALNGCATFTGGELVRKGEAYGTLLIGNNSGVAIDVVTLSRCNAMSHGLNRLGNGQRINNNSGMTVQLGVGCWDIMVGRSGTCAEVAGRTGCNWLQSPSYRFQITAGATHRVNYGPNG